MEGVAQEENPLRRHSRSVDRQPPQGLAGVQRGQKLASAGEG